MENFCDSWLATLSLSSYLYASCSDEQNNMRRTCCIFASPPWFVGVQELPSRFFYSKRHAIYAYAYCMDFHGNRELSVARKNIRQSKEALNNKLLL